ncbi:Stk1 family PASTA domain-containing Ser/Thr kinase [Streptomyces sp. SCSIO 30461]|uniref:Stk1 family PASTA domain-containing Ser/Thr kinase n=1 Tax=Streptomyces sp. SCSIO 30461 TaxID=3118085 RepID=UPI0030D5A21E
MDTTLQDPLVGQLLDGRYRVDARIAVGGMATVYRAVDIRLDRVLALKVMHPELAADASFVERFIREAKSVARLSHPNVVGVYDQGAQGAYVFLAMEYVPGCNLRDVLRERGALQARAALDILEPVLAALGAAHRAGFVHRDMKPENVLIGDDGRVKVADFGLVRAVGSVTNTTGSVLGTVSYLAPEQIESGTAGTEADVYACGVMLYEMLTGAKPHTGDSPAQVLYQHLNEDVPAPSAAVPGLPTELDTLVAAATGRDPQSRPADAVALLALTRGARAGLSDAQLDAVPPQSRAVEHDAAGDRTSVIPRAVPSGQVPAGHGAVGHGTAQQGGVEHTSRLVLPADAPEGFAPPRRWQRPRRSVLAVVVAALLLLGVGTGVWYVNSGQFTRVPSVLGKTEAEARKRLTDAGLDVEPSRKDYSDIYERGTVMAADPAQGKRIRQNGSVTLVISRGPEIVDVPKLQGLNLADARNALRKAGLAPGAVTRKFDENAAQGTVTDSDPVAGIGVRADSAVALVVSKGAPIGAPGIVGETVDDATAALEEAGLKVRIAPERVHSPEQAGAVAAQVPAEGARLAAGDTVTLTVSKGPRMIRVPDVIGDDVDSATDELKAAGFEVKVERSFPFLGTEVQSQSVAGGGQAPEGSTVTIKTKGF